MERVTQNVFRLRQKHHAWNVDGSSTDSYRDQSWIGIWEEATGQGRESCSFDDCCKQAQVGGHVWIKRVGVFIAPICNGCNYHMNMKRMQNVDGHHSFLRSGTTVLKVELTEDMCNADRRISVYEEDSEEDSEEESEEESDEGL